MKKRNLFWISFINIAVLAIIAIVIFLILPNDLQKSYSVGLYIFSALGGLLIGNLIAKVYFLKKSIVKEKEALNKKQENLQIYIGNVVHDLRSPVASINMISELLEDDLDNIDIMHKDLITSIRKSSTTMLDRICCILDNAKAQQTEAFENMEASNPTEVIKEVIKKHHILAIDKEIDLVLNISESLPNVYFDNDSLNSILSNLLSNAIKYSMPRTTVEIYNTVEKGKISFCIKDQGLGLTKDDLSKVFGRFTKLSAQPTAGEDSSGLGLSIVKNMAERMNGSVSAISAGKGKGATFIVTLKTTAKAKRITA